MAVIVVTSLAVLQLQASGRYSPLSVHSAYNSAFAMEGAAVFKALYHSDHHLTTVCNDHVAHVLLHATCGGHMRYILCHVSRAHAGFDHMY